MLNEVVTCACVRNRGARGIEPETFRRRGQLLSRSPTAGPEGVWTNARVAAAFACILVHAVCGGDKWLQCRRAMTRHHLCEMHDVSDGASCKHLA